MIKRNINLTKPQEDVLKALASKTGLSVSELIRRAIDQYIAEIS